MADGSHGSSVELLDALQAAATRLVEQARWEGAYVTWRTPVSVPPSTPDGEWRWTSSDASPYLYDGLAGIARGLALAAPVLSSRDAALSARMRTTAATAINQAVTGASDAGAGTASGLYDGRLGTACVAAELGRLWNDVALGRRGLALALGVLAEVERGDRIDPWSATDQARHDLISGTAGLICGAAWLAAWMRSGPAAEAAGRLAARLTDLDDMGPGLAHGLAGVTVALAHVHRTLGQPWALPRLVEAERLENAWFSQEAGGWPDVRPDEIGRTGPNAGRTASDWASFPAWWCHGTVGVGFGRQRVADLTRVPSADADVARDFVRTALESGGLPPPLTQDGVATPLWADWSLCHGATGAAAFLLTRPARPHGGADEALARHVLARGAMAAQAAGGRWRGGAPVDDEQSGLMTGHAGILLVLTRVLAGESRSSWPLWL